MSTKDLTRSAPEHKALNLYDAQVQVYENAKEAVKNELGDDVTEGEIVRELARAYTGYNQANPPSALSELLDEHASDNGDPTYSYGELKAMNAQRRRNLAAQVDTDVVNGRSTKIEVYAYFTEGVADE